MNEAYWKCRICLSDNISIPIFGDKIKSCQELAKKLRICMGREVPNLEGYPRNLCRDCFEAVNEAYSLITKFNETSALLEKIIFPKDIKPKIEKITEHEIEKITFIDTQDFKHSFEPLHLLEPKIEINGNYKTEKLNKPQRRIAFTGPQDFKLLLHPLIVKKETSNAFINKENATISPDSKVTNISLISKEEPFKIVNTKENIDCATEFNIEIKQNRNSPKSLLCTEKTEFNIESKENSNSPKSLLCTENLKSLAKKPPPMRKRIKYKSESLCELCGRVFETQDGLRSHVHTHNEKPVQCPACPKQYMIPDSLRMHIKRMHGAKTIVCSVCGKLFSTTAGLNSHYKLVHLKIRKKIKYPCRLCGKLYATRAGAVTHERSVHTGERPAVCEDCGASFFHELYLQEHRRLHTGETPFKCPVCGRAYAQRGNMKSHIKHNHRISELDGITLSTIDKKYFKYMKP